MLTFVWYLCILLKRKQKNNLWSKEVLATNSRHKDLDPNPHLASCQLRDLQQAASPLHALLPVWKSNCGSN